MKKRHAQAAVATAAIAAAGEGAAPIPFSDCVLLVPTQLTMIATIMVIFGFDVNKSIITALLIKNYFVSVAGKYGVDTEEKLNCYIQSYM